MYTATVVAIFRCRFYLVSNMSFYLFVLCIIIAIYLNKNYLCL